MPVPIRTEISPTPLALPIPLATAVMITARKAHNSVQHDEHLFTNTAGILAFCTIPHYSHFGSQKVRCFVSMCVMQPGL